MKNKNIIAIFTLALLVCSCAITSKEERVQQKVSLKNEAKSKIVVLINPSLKSKFKSISLGRVDSEDLNEADVDIHKIFIKKLKSKGYNAVLDGGSFNGAYLKIYPLSHQGLSSQTGIYIQNTTPLTGNITTSTSAFFGAIIKHTEGKQRGFIESSTREKSNFTAIKRTIKKYSDFNQNEKIVVENSLKEKLEREVDHILFQMDL